MTFSLELNHSQENALFMDRNKWNPIEQCLVDMDVPFSTSKVSLTDFATCGLWLSFGQIGWPCLPTYCCRFTFRDRFNSTSLS